MTIRGIPLKEGKTYDAAVSGGTATQTALYLLSRWRVAETFASAFLSSIILLIAKTKSVFIIDITLSVQM